MSTENAHTTGATLRRAWGIVRTRWHLLAASIALGVIAAIAYGAWTPRIYTGTATLRIFKKTTGMPALDALASVGGSEEDEVATEMAVMKSRTLAEGVVDTLGLELHVRASGVHNRSDIINLPIQVDSGAARATYVLEPEGNEWNVMATGPGGKRSLGRIRAGAPLPFPGVHGTLARTAPHENIFFALRSTVAAADTLGLSLRVVQPSRDANIVEIRYDDQDSSLVRTVPNALMQRFVTYRDQNRRAGAANSVSFIKEQLDTLNHQLGAAETDLREFREGHNIINPDAQSLAGVQGLAQLIAERDAIAQERAALTSALVQARVEAQKAPVAAPSPYRHLLAFPTLLKDPATADILRSLDEADATRQQLLTHRTVKDPDVIAATDRVHALEQNAASVASSYISGLASQQSAIEPALTRSASTLQSLPATEIQYARLTRSAKVLEDVYSLLQTRLKEAQIAEAAEDLTAQVVDPAVTPDKPVWPRPALLIGAGIILGTLLGLALLALADALDSTVHSRADIRVVARLRVLAAIPRIRSARVALPFTRRMRRVKSSLQPVARSYPAALVAETQPRSPGAEAYRVLRTNLTTEDGVPNIIVFTSPAPGDGKTTTLGNLAVTMATQGKRVVMVDTDLRRGMLHAMFNAKSTPGLANVLSGAMTLEDALRPLALHVRGYNGTVDLLAAGDLPENPSEALESTQMKDCLAKLRTMYDVVLVDTPPLNLFADATIVGRDADAVVLVARAGKTRRGELDAAAEQLDAVQAKTVGAVLNDYDATRDTGYEADAYGSYQYNKSYTPGVIGGVAPGLR